MKASDIEMFMLHSTMPSFINKVEKSKKVIKEFLEKCSNPYVAWSTGKDSTAVLGLTRGVKEDVVAVHIDSGVELPGTDETREKVNNVIHFKTERPFLDLAEEFGLETKETRKSVFVKQLEETYSFDGVLMGLRADESRTRKQNAKRGMIYQRRDGMWICNPILYWTMKDVFAYIVSRGLPIHPHYLMDGPFELKHRRVGSYVSSRNRGSEFGRFAQLRYFYPEIYEELVNKFPELKTYV